MGHWHRECFQDGGVQATFFQKVIICAVAGFAAACLFKWGMVFVEGADDALNGGYPKTRTTEVIPASR